MASRTPSPSSSKIPCPSSSGKAKRKILSINEKYGILQDYDKGMTRLQLMEKCGLKKTTIHDLIKSREKVQ